MKQNFKLVPVRFFFYPKMRKKKERQNIKSKSRSFYFKIARFWYCLDGNFKSQTLKP